MDDLVLDLHFDWETIQVFVTQEQIAKSELVGRQCSVCAHTIVRDWSRHIASKGCKGATELDFNSLPSRPFFGSPDPIPFMTPPQFKFGPLDIRAVVLRFLLLGKQMPYQWWGAATTVARAYEVASLGRLRKPLSTLTEQQERDLINMADNHSYLILKGPLTDAPAEKRPFRKEIPRQCAYCARVVFQSKDAHAKTHGRYETFEELEDGWAPKCPFFCPDVGEFKDHGVFGKKFVEGKRTDLAMREILAMLRCKQSIPKPFWLLAAKAVKLYSIQNRGSDPLRVPVLKPTQLEFDHLWYALKGEYNLKNHLLAVLDGRHSRPEKSLPNPWHGYALAEFYGRNRDIFATIEEATQKGAIAPRIV